jgi:hypothetical protein
VAADYLPVRRHRPPRYMVGIRICSRRITEELALGAIRLNELDSHLGVVAPDRLASSDGLACEYKIKDLGNALRGLNF